MRAWDISSGGFKGGAAPSGSYFCQKATFFRVKGIFFGAFAINADGADKLSPPPRFKISASVTGHYPLSEGWRGKHKDRLRNSSANLYGTECSGATECA